MHDFRGEKVDVRKRQNYPRIPTNFKNSFIGIQIEAIRKNRQNIIFFLYKFIEEFQFDFWREKKREGF